MTQGFDEWMNKKTPYGNVSIRQAFKAGAASRQAEIDELRKRLSIYEKHLYAIKFIHENQFDENSDTSFILGNLDGFFECLDFSLKGDSNE